MGNCIEIKTNYRLIFDYYIPPRGILLGRDILMHKLCTRVQERVCSRPSDENYNDLLSVDQLSHCTQQSCIAYQPTSAAQC
jgi:hypothetical protein